MTSKRRYNLCWQLYKDDKVPAAGAKDQCSNLQMRELAEFPLQLANVMDSQILRAAAKKLASLFPELSYIRYEVA
jgi:hypothetical protein